MFSWANTVPQNLGHTPLQSLSCSSTPHYWPYPNSCHLSTLTPLFYLKWSPLPSLTNIYSRSFSVSCSHVFHKFNDPFFYSLIALCTPSMPIDYMAKTEYNSFLNSLSPTLYPEYAIPWHINEVIKKIQMDEGEVKAREAVRLRQRMYKSPFWTQVTFSSLIFVQILKYGAFYCTLMRQPLYT